MNRRILLYKSLIIAIISAFPFSVLFSQPVSLLNNEASCFYEEVIYNRQSGFHTCIKPFPVIGTLQMDSVKASYKMNTHTDFINCLLNKNLISLSPDSWTCNINPVFTYLPRYDFQTGRLPFRTETGLSSSGSYRSQLAWFVTSSYSAIELPMYLQQRTDSTGVIPGMGKYQRKNNGMYSGIFSDLFLFYSPSTYFNVMTGKGRHFFGDGYRSLLLSDCAPSYPFLRITFSAWRLKYIYMFSFLENYRRDSINLTGSKKYSASHLLSWNIRQRINFYLFETVIWRQGDNWSFRGTDINYLNPFVFFRPVEYNLGEPSPDNVLFGTGMRIKVSHSGHLYAQSVLDEFNLNEIRKKSKWWGNKYGFQAGFKTYRLFSLKNMFFMCEYNTVRPYTYSHIETTENYGHLYHPLAHPLGANFREVVSVVRYHYKRWFFSQTFQYAVYGEDSTSASLGRNIFISYTQRPSDYGHETTQGIKTKTFFYELKISFLVNPHYPLFFETGLQNHITGSESKRDRNTFLFVGFHTLLYNNNED